MKFNDRVQLKSGIQAVIMHINDDYIMVITENQKHMTISKYDIERVYYKCDFCNSPCLMEYCSTYDNV